MLAVNNQSVYLLNMTSSRFTEVPNTHGVLSVSVEWITQRLFWANPHRQMVNIILLCYRFTEQSTHEKNVY